jgi:hypothetical protein
VFLLQASAQHDAPRSFSAIRGATLLDPQLVGTREGLDFIRRYAAEIRASALVATVDHELVWLAKHRDEFGPCRVLSQPAASLFTLLSKRTQIELAGRAGLSVLPTYYLRRPEDAATVPDDRFPLALRPDRPEDVEPAFKVRRAASRDQLQRLIGDCRRLDSPIVAQPLQRLPNLVVHGVRAEHGQVIGSACFDVPRTFENVSLSVKRRPFPDGLEAQCHEFARLAEITGCYHLDMLFSPSDNRAYLLDANVRLGGTTDKVVRAGFDEPALLLQAYGIIPAPPLPARGTSRRVANSRVLLKHIARAVTGKLSDTDYPDASRLRHVAYSVRDLILAKDSTFDWRDVPGSIRFLLRP